MYVCIYFLKKEFVGFLSFSEAVSEYWYWSASIGSSPTVISAKRHGADRGAKG